MAVFFIDQLGSLGFNTCECILNALSRITSWPGNVTQSNTSIEDLCDSTVSNINLVYFLFSDSTVSSFNLVYFFLIVISIGCGKLARPSPPPTR